jgi:hypothetical protein
MKLLAKRPEHRPRNAADFCDALEALAQAGKLGGYAKTPPADEAAAGMPDLARALSTTPISSELVAVDGAPVAPPANRAIPAGRAKTALGLAPPIDMRGEAMPPPVHALPINDPAAAAEDLAITQKDVPAFDASDERRRSAERSQEVEGLRAALGLQVEEPASKVDDPFQVSALVVNLEAGEVHAEKPDSATGAKAGPAGAKPQTGIPLVRLSRPVEERQYVPRLAAPTRRPGTTSKGQPNLARPPSRFLRVVRVAAAIILLGAAAAAYWLIR